MIVAWKYKERPTTYQRLDPRARLVFMLALLFAVIQVWDLRLLIGFLGVAVAQFVATRLTWRETRAFWLIMGGFVTFITLLTFLTGRGGFGVFTDTQIIWQGRLGWFGLTISSERIAFGISQFVRLVTMALLVSVFPYTIHPARYGATFKGLGLSDKFAFATDLAFRFVPNLSHDFATTIDAQKARGYELERAGGLVRALRNLAPLLVPVTIGTMLKGEELIDAINLRAFDTGRRTSYHHLVYRPADYGLLALGIGTLLTITLLNIGVRDFGDLWVPGWLLPA
jgi:energy-coupling factor transport system permease protein